MGGGNKSDDGGYGATSAKWADWQGEEFKNNILPNFIMPALQRQEDASKGMVPIRKGMHKALVAPSSDAQVQPASAAAAGSDIPFAKQSSAVNTPQVGRGEQPWSGPKVGEIRPNQARKEDWSLGQVPGDPQAGQPVGTARGKGEFLNDPNAVIPAEQRNSQLNRPGAYQKKSSSSKPAGTRTSAPAPGEEITNPDPSMGITRKTGMFNQWAQQTGQPVGPQTQAQAQGKGSPGPGNQTLNQTQQEKVMNNDQAVRDKYQADEASKQAMIAADRAMKASQKPKTFFDANGQQALEGFAQQVYKKPYANLTLAEQKQVQVRANEPMPTIQSMSFQNAGATTTPTATTTPATTATTTPAKTATTATTTPAKTATTTPVKTKTPTLGEKQKAAIAEANAATKTATDNLAKTATAWDKANPKPAELATDSREVYNRKVSDWTKKRTNDLAAATNAVKTATTASAAATKAGTFSWDKMKGIQTTNGTLNFTDINQLSAYLNDGAWMAKNGSTLRSYIARDPSIGEYLNSADPAMAKTLGYVDPSTAAPTEDYEGETFDPTAWGLGKTTPGPNLTATPDSVAYAKAYGDVAATPDSVATGQAYADVARTPDSVAAGQQFANGAITPDAAAAQKAFMDSAATPDSVAAGQQFANGAITPDAAAAGQAYGKVATTPGAEQAGQQFANMMNNSQMLQIGRAQSGAQGSMAASAAQRGMGGSSMTATQQQALENMANKQRIMAQADTSLQRSGLEGTLRDEARTAEERRLAVESGLRGETRDAALQRANLEGTLRNETRDTQERGLAVGSNLRGETREAALARANLEGTLRNEARTTKQNQLGIEGTLREESRGVAMDQAGLQTGLREESNRNKWAQTGWEDDQNAKKKTDMWNMAGYLEQDAIPNTNPNSALAPAASLAGQYAGLGQQTANANNTAKAAKNALWGSIFNAAGSAAAGGF